MRHERQVVASARSLDGNKSIVLLRTYKNFQTWYDIEIDKWVNGQVQVSVKDCLDMDKAFDFYEKYIKTNKMIEK